MKKLIVLATVLTLFITAVSAQDRGAGFREQRTQRSFQSGQITRGEKNRLKRDEARFRTEKRRAGRDGRITSTERRRLNKMRHNNRRDLYRARHNNRRRVI